MDPETGGPWTLGDRLDKARKMAGLSVEQLAHDLGYTRNMLSRWTHDGAVPRAAVLTAWAQRCGVTVEWLLGEEPYPYPLSAANRARELVSA